MMLLIFDYYAIAAIFDTLILLTRFRLLFSLTPAIIDISIFRRERAAAADAIFRQHYFRHAITEDISLLRISTIFAD